MGSKPDTLAALYGKTVDRPFDDTLARAERVLEAEGFGVLCRIDVQAKLAEKLGVEMAPYRILGACLPAMAHRAIRAVPEVGVLLPCNVVVRALDDHRTRVEVVNTDAMVRMFPDGGLESVADEVGQRLARVLEAV